MAPKEKHVLDEKGREEKEGGSTKPCELSHGRTPEDDAAAAA